ncbi:lysozyme [Paraburkholderia sp. JPY418]|uniref:Lysozyme n=2 Tax=Paraburkholderia youngii TaxID=2782701 RepID=A0A7Y6K2X3_9BURK|nr:lysozyme [Paraburkholderia youngii]NUY02856.1 lysozyme [Paraburkholderia youngii]NVI04742.1 lysozyme [Paraburkholderia youngii]
MPNANSDKSMSEAGYTALRINEGVVMRYYNDAPKNGNCTWGIGTLAHFGPCTAEELARTVVPEEANTILRNRVREAEAAVKTVVTQYELTQAQFDAAVSFAYNSSRQNTRDALGPANTGDMTAVAEKMMLNVMITPRDRNGRKIGPAKRSRGLTSRRQRESAPFRQSAQ